MIMYNMYAFLKPAVHVQLDPTGCLVISGEPGHPNNPWV